MVPSTTQCQTIIIRSSTLNTNPALFECYFRVRWNECDPQGIVFNARYVDYIDLAMTEYFRARLEHGYQSIYSLGIEVVVVDVHVSWKASAKAEEIIVIKIPTPTIGNSSISFTPEFYREDGTTLIATGNITYVCVDTNQTKTPIPEALKTKLLTRNKHIVQDLTGTRAFFS